MVTINLNDKNELINAISRLSNLAKKSKGTNARIISDRIKTYQHFINDIEKRELMQEKLDNEYYTDSVNEMIENGY